MNKRVASAIIAVVLAVFGVGMLLNYASAADERAYQGTRLQTVLQVNEVIPAKTPADELGSFVKRAQLPTTAVAKDAITDLDDLAGMESTVELEPGEQLLLTRFAKVGAAEAKKKSVVPEGMQEITVALSIQRVDPRTAVGDTVGVIASYEDEDATNVLKDGVIVTRIENIEAVAANDQQASVLVTLAVDTEDAEKVANASEFGRIWLTRQSAETNTSGSTRIEPKDILQ